MSSKFDDNKNVRTYKDSYLIKELFKYVLPEMKYFILAFLFTIIVVVIDLLPAYFLGEVFGILDNKLYSDFEKMKYSLTKVSLLMSFIVIGAVINYNTTMILQRAGQRVVKTIRKDVFVHIESLSIAQINDTPVGKLVTRVTSDVNMVNELYTNIIVNLIRNVLTIIFVFIVMLSISVKLTMYVSLFIPLLIITLIVFKNLSRKQYRNVRGSVSNTNAFLSENLSGMKITQIFNQEEKKIYEFNQRNNELKKNQIKEIMVFSIFRPFIFLFYIGCQGFILYKGYSLVKTNIITSNKLVTYYTYINTFFNPIQQIADQFNQLQQAFASAERLFEIINTKIDILDSKDAIEVEGFKGKIEFKNVYFAYKDENWILKDVSFVINPRETVAFVGATGAGKTTILALIVRNYEIQKGQILIDDIDISKIKIESLRKYIGQMLQDVFLFSGSIRNNITLREPSFTNEQIVDACKYVNADKFIETLENGLDHKVLERGANFSSGQRQLLSFARTVIHNPNIMILDEATANIDTKTEVLIQHSLEKMKNVGTMLIVAHRLSTIKDANKIIVLHKGEIKEMGSHQELLDKKGLYYNLYEIQYKHLEKNI